MSDLYRLIYGSRSAGEAPVDVDEIVAVSQRNNAAVGVTGILVSHGGVFIQALEGPREAVEGVYGRVLGHGRHDAVRIVSAGPADERLFAAWSMCSATLDLRDAEILAVVGDPDALDPEFLDPIPTLNLLSAVSQMQSLPAQAA